MSSVMLSLSRDAKLIFNAFCLTIWCCRYYLLRYRVALGNCLSCELQSSIHDIYTIEKCACSFLLSNIHQMPERLISMCGHYFGSQYCLVRFEPVSVDCCNEITCFGCVFVNSIVEVNLTSFVGSLRLQDCLRRYGVRFSWLL